MCSVMPLGLEMQTPLINVALPCLFFEITTIYRRERDASYSRHVAHTARALVFSLANKLCDDFDVKPERRLDSKLRHSCEQRGFVYKRSQQMSRLDRTCWTETMNMRLLTFTPFGWETMDWFSTSLSSYCWS